MKKDYKWLIVVEGRTDVRTYGGLLVRYGVNERDFWLAFAHGKDRVYNTSKWGNINTPNSSGENLLATVQTDVGVRVLRV